MAELSVTQSQKKALTGATIIALVGGAYFLRPYFSMIVLAAIIAFMFNPIYQRLNNRWNSPGKASATTLLIALLVLIIPFLLILAVSAQQIIIVADAFDSTAALNFISEAIDTVNHQLASWGFDVSLNQASIVEALQGPLRNFGQNVLQALPGVFSGFFSFFTTSIIFLFVFLSLLKNQKTIVRTIYNLNPLGNDISKLYLQKASSMTKAMVRGQFVIAAAQGFTDAALLALAGLPELFFFFFVLLTALSIIPLGGGIVAIPIGIIMILTGNIWGGLLVIAGHIVIVTNIDNVLRPQLVPKDAKLDSALTLLAVFAGLKAFGFLGIVLGPVIMILIVTTIRVYQEVHGKASEDSVLQKSKGAIGRFFARLKKLFRR